MTCVIRWRNLLRMSKKEDSLSNIIQNPQKRRAWVKFQIHLKGLSMAKIAADLGVTRGCLYAAFDRPYPRMEQVLAEAVGMTPQSLFPERYDALGVPNRTIGRPRNSTDKDTKKLATCNVTGRKAA